MIPKTTANVDSTHVLHVPPWGPVLGSAFARVCACARALPGRGMAGRPRLPQRRQLVAVDQQEVGGRVRQ